jgi:hypothetical protein
MRLTILILLIAALPFLCSAVDKKRVCFPNVCVESVIADTDGLRTKGLMFRDNLGEKQAMLFIFPEEDKYSFWMKNMRFALDIIWVDRNKKIVEIKKNIQPCNNNICESFTPQVKTKYVLELNSGFTDKYRINLGDNVKF